jgi:hypothetical protein
MISDVKRHFSVPFRATWQIVAARESRVAVTGVPTPVPTCTAAEVTGK